MDLGWEIETVQGWGTLKAEGCGRVISWCDEIIVQETMACVYYRGDGPVKAQDGDRNLESNLRNMEVSH